MTPMLKLLGMTVRCPENRIPAQRISIDDHRIEMLDLSQTYLSLLASGNFEINVLVNEHGEPRDQPFFCGTFKYTLKQKK
jgi:hypothetical protein